MDEALSLVQKHHLSQQSTKTWLDSAGALLQRASLGVELEIQTDCIRDLDGILSQEQSLTAALEELRTLDPLLEHFMEAGAMSKLREELKAMRLRDIEVKQQLEAYRELLQRCVFIYLHIQYMYGLLVLAVNTPIIWLHTHINAHFMYFL